MRLIDQHIEDMSQEIAKLNLALDRAARILEKHTNCADYIEEDSSHYKKHHVNQGFNGCHNCLIEWLLSDDND